MTESSQETRARRIIERLKMFNRKERDHLMKFALCDKPEAPRISNALWKKISNGGTKPNADRMFIGMDYHLNWLYAALATAEMSDEDLEIQFDNEWKCKSPPKDSKDFSPIQENQQDVDLLIAWFDQRWAIPLRLILVEAKLHSGWDSEQFESKKERLTLMRQDAINRKLNFIDWKFLLLSPGTRPERNGFDANELKEPYDWILDREAGQGEPRLWHETLPVTQLRQVKRVSEKFDKWEIV